MIPYASVVAKVSSLGELLTKNSLEDLKHFSNQTNGCENSECELLFRDSVVGKKEKGLAMQDEDFKLVT